MTYDYIKKFDMNYFGCVVILDDIPTLFITNKNNISNGISLLDSRNQYSIIKQNEIVIVALSIYFDGKGIDIEYINEDNINLMTYNIMPLHIHQLKTNGFTIVDIFQLGMFNDIVFNILNDFIKETTS